MSGAFTPCRHLRLSSGPERTAVILIQSLMMIYDEEKYWTKNHWVEEDKNKSKKRHIRMEYGRGTG